MNRRIAIHPRRCAAIGMLAMLALMALAPGAAVAAERVGEVLSARGRVIADGADMPPRRLERGDPVYAGDTIETGRLGRVQLRFQDGGLVDLQPSSRFRIDEYRGEQGGGSVILSFLRGALRTITGAIGHDRGETYRMNTPVATIGVRGTAYALYFCDRACAASGVRAGLYGRVGAGAIVIEGAVFTAGEFFFVPLNGGPRRIVAPPEGILDGRGGGAAPGDDERITDVRIEPLGPDERVRRLPIAGAPAVLEPGFDAGEATRLEPAERPAVPTSTSSGVSIAVAGKELIQGVELSETALFDEGGPYTTDAQNRVTGATVRDDSPSFGLFTPLGPPGSPVDTTVVSGSLAESGTTLGVRWGRWQGEIHVEGVGNTGTLDNDSFAYTITDNLTNPAVLASLTGTLTYSLAGGPHAFDTAGGLGSNGNLWRVDSLRLSVDFGSGTLALDAFIVSEIGADDTNSFDAFSFDGNDVVARTLNLADNRFAFSLEKLDDRAQIDGRFVGVRANGAIVVFEINGSNGIEEVVGTKILSAQ